VPFVPLDPGLLKNQDPGSGSEMFIFPRAWKLFFGLKFGADSGSVIFLTLDPGWKYSYPGSGLNTHPATLPRTSKEEGSVILNFEITYIAKLT